MRHQRNREYSGWGSLRGVAVAATILALLSLAPALQAQPPVEVAIDVAGTPNPGGTLNLSANVNVNDGSSIQGYQWMQVGGIEGQITNPGAANTGFVLPPVPAFRLHLHDLLHEPPITADQLPPNVPPPPEEFPGGLQDRFEVVGLNPFVLEEAALVEVRLMVTTTSGTYAAGAEIHASIPYRSTSGIANVPINRPVLLHARHQDGYDWALDVPAGSNATLIGAGSVFPVFTPDVAGIYTLTVTDQAAGAPVEILVYAGNWRGVIVGQDADGRPISDPICTACHSGDLIGDQFEPWSQTGHAEIFTDQLNGGTHWGERCFDCHSVGFDRSAMNNGIDEAPGYQAFLDSGLINNPGDNWTQVLNQWPTVARRANVQCENCHGPAASEPGFDTLAHGWIPTVEGEPRVSLSSDVCAQCHGEPLRHGRHQQWQLSAHANYDLAIREADSGSCARCHTGNGFLAWLPVLLGEEPGDPTASVEVTWTADTSHPQTCVTCHDPHDIGTRSGSNSNATVRISGNTPPLIAGFQVFGAGRGAICMTCHNSRRGLRFDGNFAEVAGTAEAGRAPHGSSQTDVLMGENAYMVNTGIRGRHSLLADSCVACHMQQTPPPDVLSYNQGGTNHTFQASSDVCSQCHEGVTNDGLHAAVEGMLDHLKAVLENRLKNLMQDEIDGGNSIDLDGDATVTMASAIAGVEFTEFRGRQAVIVTLSNGDVVGPMRITDVLSVPPGGGGQDLYAISPLLAKAGWNWALIHNDGSYGAHNPSWVLEVLDATRDALGDYGGPRVRHFPELVALGVEVSE